jgi:hypothetical protein
MAIGDLGGPRVVREENVENVEDQMRSEEGSSRKERKKREKERERERERERRKKIPA